LTATPIHPSVHTSEGKSSSDGGVELELTWVAPLCFEVEFLLLYLLCSLKSS